MAQSKAPDVPSYITEAAPERASYLARLRELCRTELDGYQEEMRWGMPVYARDGQAEFAFANQKQYIALYVMKPEVVEKNAVALAGLNHGKGCIRFRTPETIDFALVAQLLRDTKASASASC